MANGRKSNDGAPLETGITMIGQRKGMYKGEPTVFTIFYGNLVLPMIDGEFKHLTLDKYEKMLHDFLFESEEGEKYAVPSDEEKRQAINLVLEKEPEMIKEHAHTQEDSEETIETEPVETVYTGPSYESLIEEENNRNVAINELHEEDEGTYKAKNEGEKHTNKGIDSTGYLKRKVLIQTVIISIQFILLFLLTILYLKG